MAPESSHKVLTIVHSKRRDSKVFDGKFHGAEVVDYLSGVMHKQDDATFLSQGQSVRIAKNFATEIWPFLLLLQTI